MNVTDAIKSRRTYRAYKPDLIPDDELRELIDIARWSPSNTNTQPWHFAVVSGKPLRDLENELLKHIMSGGQQNPAFEPSSVPLKGVHKERQYDCANRYYGTMGIKREDKNARNMLALKNFQFFGAPHAAFLSMPADMNHTNSLDLGIFLQSFMLLLTERGMASCAQGALAMYPDPIFKVANIPEGNAIVCGISFGYADDTAKINETRMIRADLEDVASFVS